MDHFHPRCVYGEERNLEILDCSETVVLLLFHSFLYCSNQICTLMVDQWQRLSKSAKPLTLTDPWHAEVRWAEMRMSLELISRQVTWPGFKALLLHS